MLEFIPRKQLTEHLRNGWRLIPGHEYRLNDYAVLMAHHESPEPVSPEAVWRTLLRHPNPTVTCRMEGCRNIHHAFGVCRKHYLRLKRTGSPLTVRSPGPARKLAEASC